MSLLGQRSIQVKTNVRGLPLLMCLVIPQHNQGGECLLSSVINVVVLGISDEIVLRVPICLRKKVHHETGVNIEALGASPNPLGPKAATIEAGSSSSSHPPEDPVTALSDEQLEEILRTRRNRVCSTHLILT